MAVYAVLAALLHRSRSGVGQAVEVPMFESMAQFVMTPHLLGHTFRPPIGPAGYERLFHRRPYRTKDGYICAGAYSADQWNRFFDLSGQPELKNSPRYGDPRRIAAHIGELYQLFEDAMATRTTAEWMELLDNADIPAMPMHTPESIQQDPHLVATGFFQDVDHPTEGPIRTMAVPTRWSASRPAPARQAPGLGEHSAQVLREAGYSDDEIGSLMEQGITRGTSDRRSQDQPL